MDRLAALIAERFELGAASMRLCHKSRLACEATEAAIREARTGIEASCRLLRVARQAEALAADAVSCGAPQCRGGPSFPVGSS